MIDESVSNRTDIKNIGHSMFMDLQGNFSLSPAECDVLVNKIFEYREEYFGIERDEGQIIWHAVSISEPPGKPLQECKTVPVILTIHSRDDIELLHTRGTVDLRKTLVSRLTWGAYEQGGPLTQEDLAMILHVHPSTIKRIIKYYNDLGIYLPTRGNIKDIGPGVSHKTRAIEMCLEGKSFSYIMKVLHHSETSIKRYLEDFITIVLLSDDGFNAVKIRIITKKSDRIIREYLELYEKFSKEDKYKDCLNDIRERFGGKFKDIKFKKKEVIA